MHKFSTSPRLVEGRALPAAPALGANEKPHSGWTVSCSGIVLLAKTSNLPPSSTLFSDTLKTLHFCKTLQTLRIVVILLGARQPRDTRSRSRVSHSTALTILAHRSCTSSRRGDTRGGLAGHKRSSRFHRGARLHSRGSSRCSLGRGSRGSLGRTRRASTTATGRDRTTRCRVCRRVCAVVKVGNVYVGVARLVRSRELDRRTTASAGTCDADLSAANVELSAAKGL